MKRCLGCIPLYIMSDISPLLTLVAFTFGKDILEQRQQNSLKMRTWNLFNKNQESSAHQTEHVIVKKEMNSDC